jgi:membrane-associated phospholipid phosphatase
VGVGATTRMREGAPTRLHRVSQRLSRATPIRPIDRVVTSYNVLLGLVWLLAAWAAPQRAPFGWLLALAHFALAPVPWLFRSRSGRVTARIASAATLAADLYPLVVLVGTWTELGPLISALYRQYYDVVDLWLDQLVFGTHWHLRLLPSMPWPWLCETMYGAYFSLYPILLGLPIALLMTRQRRALRDFVLSVTVTHLVCFAIYLGFPVLGPWQFGSHAAQLPHSFFYALSAAVQQSGDSLGTACPSTHVAGSAAIAFVAWRQFPRAVAIAFVVDAVLIAIATVYTQNHYAFDVLDGIIVVLLVQGLAIPMLNGRRVWIPRFAMKRVATQELAN